MIVSLCNRFACVLLLLLQICLLSACSSAPDVKVTDVSYWDPKTSPRPIFINPPAWITSIRVDAKLSDDNAMFGSLFFNWRIGTEMRLCSVHTDFELLFVSQPYFTSDDDVSVFAHHPRGVPHVNNVHPTFFIKIMNGKMPLKKWIPVEEPGLLTSKLVDRLHDPIRDPEDICIRFVSYYGVLPLWRSVSKTFVIDGDALRAAFLEPRKRAAMSSQNK